MWKSAKRCCIIHAELRKPLTILFLGGISVNRIMVDNWFLGEVIRYLRAPKENPARPYAELLMALVLWDEVCFPENERSASWADGTELAGCLSPIDDRERAFDDASRELLIGIMQQDELPDPYYLWLRDPEHVVNASALRYLMLSAKHGCDYLPSTQRQAFLRTHENSRYMKGLLARMQMMGQLDERADAYYRESYKALLDFSELKLEMPVLADFIVHSTPAGMTAVEHAMHLRQEGPVIRYRAYLEQVEQALERQDWKTLRSLLAASADAMEEVVGLDRKRLSGVTVKLLPTPSVLVNYGRFRGELSASPSVSFENILGAGGRKLHLTFLKDLTAYAVNERKLL